MPVRNAANNDRGGDIKAVHIPSCMVESIAPQRTSMAFVRSQPFLIRYASIEDWTRVSIAPPCKPRKSLWVIGPFVNRTVNNVQQTYPPKRDHWARKNVRQGSNTLKELPAKDAPFLLGCIRYEIKQSSRAFFDDRTPNSLDCSGTNL